jgi:hypothetical protein
MIQLESIGLATVLEIRCLEADLGVDLPKQYRTFLLTQSNGGVPTRSTGIKISGLPYGGETDIRSVFGTATNDLYSDLRYRIQEFGYLLPKEALLQIADDSGGGVFVMDLVTTKIFFIDMPGDYETLYPVADDFNEFLERAYEGEG